MTRIVSELIDDGFLVEQSVGASTGGRRPVLLDLDTSGRVVAGLKLMDDVVIAVLVDMKGAVVADSQTPIISHEAESVISQAAAVVHNLLAAFTGSADRLAGVGLCMPGSIDWRSGVCKLSPYFGWSNVPVAQMIRSHLAVPVIVDNDVNALAMAENLFGVGRTVRDFVVVTVGRGVGAGLVANGSVYRGSSGGAGEFGHTVTELGGLQCECGKSGCLEAYIGDNALLARFRADGSAHDAANMTEFLSLLGVGDALARQMYAEIAQRLGAAIANLVNVLNPELIVVGGEAPYLTAVFVDELRRCVDEHVFSGLTGSYALRLEPWRADRTAWARGAATLAMEHMFHPAADADGMVSI